MQTVIVEVRVEVQTLSLFGGGGVLVVNLFVIYIHCINGFGS